jgi:hypothetical protein
MSAMEDMLVESGAWTLMSGFSDPDKVLSTGEPRTLGRARTEAETANANGGARGTGGTADLPSPPEAPAVGVARPDIEQKIAELPKGAQGMAAKAGARALARKLPLRGPHSAAGTGSTATRAATAPAYGGLSKAGQFGIQPYKQLKKALKGTGLEAHHLLEQRFAEVLGQNARHMESVAVTKAEHQAFTNAWRALIPYGQGTANATTQQVLDAAKRIYSGHPELLRALGL